MSFSCHKATDPNMGLYPQASSKPSLPKGPLPQTDTLGAGLPHAFWGDTDIQCMELGVVLFVRATFGAACLPSLLPFLHLEPGHL